jgi:hypothetical protein
MTLTSPGAPNHISEAPITSIVPNAAIQGLRRPLPGVSLVRRPVSRL